MSVKINTLEVENVKRVKAVSLTPTQTGLTIIGGNNSQGKTTVLDAICWAVGGNKYKPTNAVRDGAYTDPHIRITLSNGLVVERAGKNSALKVIDPQGNKSGQALLDSFISELALNLPKFLNASDKDKADTLLRIIGVGDQLAQMENDEQRLYNQRRAVGQIADQKKKFAAELPSWPNVPEQPVTASELIRQQQEILARNGANMQRRDELRNMQAKYGNLRERLDGIERQIQQLTESRAEVTEELTTLGEAIDAAIKTVTELHDESTAEIEQSIAEIDAVNAKVRDNIAKVQAEHEAAELSGQYDELTEQIEGIRKARTDLLNSADLPLPGLSVAAGKLLYNGKAWDCMSGSEQLRVATAIVRRLNPECGFVLLDKLEQMDMQTLAEFGQWLESEGLQAIATRVSTGDECSVIIEDGYIAGSNGACPVAAPPEEPPKQDIPRYVPGWNK